MNNKPSLESQFLATLLAFTTLLYGNVWLMAQTARPAEMAGYAVNSQSAKAAPPDFSGWSREEVGEYVVAEVERQLNNPANYLAVATKSNNPTTVSPAGNTTDISTPSPQPGISAASQATPPIQPPPVTFPLPPGPRCNIPQLLFSINTMATQAAFVSPKLEPFRNGEFHLPVNAGAGRFSTISLGSDGFSPQRGEQNLQIREGIAGFSASGNRIVYYIKVSGSQTGKLVVRGAGPNNRFDAGQAGIGNDDTLLTLFNPIQTPPRLFIPESNSLLTGKQEIVDIVKDRVVFLVQAGENPTNSFIVEVRGLGGNPTVSIPSLSPAMPILPSGYAITKLETGLNNTIAFVARVSMPYPPYPLDSNLYAISAGLNGTWGDIDDVAVSFARSGYSVQSPSLSDDNRFLAYAMYYTSGAGGSFYMKVEDFGADFTPGTGDERSSVVLQPNPNLYADISGISVDGFLANARQNGGPSNARVTARMETLVHTPSPGPLGIATTEFIETGPNGVFEQVGSPGTDDVKLSLPQGGTLLTVENNSVWLNRDWQNNRTYINEIRWCY